jgi:hypothetical protein
MSSLADIRTAIGEKIAAADTTAFIMYGADSAETAQVRRHQTVVNVLFIGEDADPSLVLGAQYQERIWTWEVQVVTPASAQNGASNEDRSWTVVNAIEAKVAPNGSDWHPATDCGPVQLVDKRLFGVTQAGFLATLTVSHVKWL